MYADALIELAEKPAFSGLLCSGARATPLQQQRSLKCIVHDSIAPIAGPGNAGAMTVVNRRPCQVSAPSDSV